MIEVQIFIPECDNNQQAYAQSMHDAWEIELVRLFNGFTRLLEKVKGGWVYQGILYPDASWVYLVALASITNGGLIRDAVEFAKANYQQINIYVRYLALAEIL